MATEGVSSGTDYYIRSLMHAREECTAHINQAKSVFDDIATYVRDPNPMNEQYRLHRDLQTALFNYHSEVRPYAEDIAKEWNEEIESEVFGTASLADIGDLPLGKRQTENSYSQPGRPPERDITVKEMLVPVPLAEDIRDQLNDCVKAIGFFPRKQKTPLYHLKRDPDQYDDPVKEDIPKPQ